MIIHIFDRNFTRIGMLKTYVSLIWAEDYQASDMFLLTLTDNSENIKLLEIGNFILLNGKQTAGIITEVIIESDVKRMKVAGYNSLFLLEQRIIRNTISVTNAEAGMREIVQENIRGFQNLLVATAKNFPEVFHTQYTYKGVLTALNEIAIGTGLGIRMIFDHRNKQHIFEVYKGLDRRQTQNENPQAVFSDDLKNLYDLTITDDNTFFKNFAYVAGAGDGDERKVIEIGSVTGQDRFELFVDARDLQPDREKGETIDSDSYIKTLEGRGKTRLNEYIRRRSFEVSINPADFGIRYNLGDMITCRSVRYGIVLSARIQKYSEIIENNIRKMNLVMGDPRLDVIGAERLWQK